MWWKVLSCKKAGFITIKRDKVNEIEATFLLKVWKDAKVEPSVQDPMSSMVLGQEPKSTF